MSKVYKHLVKVEVQAMMSDDGEIYLPELIVQADLTDLQPPKKWCEDSATYTLDKPVPITTNCGVVRKLLGISWSPDRPEECFNCGSKALVEESPGTNTYTCTNCGQITDNGESK